MADISREVLRHKPYRIEQFIFKYIDSLMKIRKVANGVSQEVDKTIRTGAKQKLVLERLNVSYEEVNKAVPKMQAIIRGFLARRKYKAALTKKRTLMINTYDVPHMTTEILTKYKLTHAQANSMCTKIQAVVRGWLIRKKNLVDIPSHESWRHDWLWKEFQMTPEEVQAISRAEKKQVLKTDDLMFQPRRSIEIDHIKFMKAFKGELADYDDNSEISSMEDISDDDVTIEGDQNSEERSGGESEKMIEIKYSDDFKSIIETEDQVLVNGILEEYEEIKSEFHEETEGEQFEEVEGEVHEALIESLVPHEEMEILDESEAHEEMIEINIHQEIEVEESELREGEEFYSEVDQEVIQEEIDEATQEDIQELVQEDMPEETQEGIVEDAEENILEEVQENIPEDISDGLQENIQEEPLNEILSFGEELNIEEVHEVIQEEIREDIQEELVGDELQSIDEASNMGPEEVIEEET